MIKTKIEIDPPKFHVGDDVAYILTPGNRLGKVIRCCYVAESGLSDNVGQWEYKVFRTYKDREGRIRDHSHFFPMEKDLTIFC